MKRKSKQIQWPTKTIVLCSFIASVVVTNPVMATTQSDTDAEGKIDPCAIEALGAMGSFLQGLPAFEVKSDFYRDEVVDSGQKILVSGYSTLIAEHPSHLFSHVVVDEYDQDHNLYYDGNTFSLYGNTSKYYSSIPTRAKTINDLVVNTFAQKDIELPLADLFLWGTKYSSTDIIKEAYLIGETTITGMPCTHYAYREEGFDWQIWIKKGEQPLPLQFVITTVDIPSHPQYTARLKWNLEPKLSDDMFVFTPPKGAVKIDLVSLEEPKGNSKQEPATKEAK